MAIVDNHAMTVQGFFARQGYSGAVGIGVAVGSPNTTIAITVGSDAYAVFKDGAWLDSTQNANFASTTLPAPTSGTPPLPTTGTYYLWLDHDSSNLNPVWTAQLTSAAAPSPSAIVVAIFSVAANVVTTATPKRLSYGITGARQAAQWARMGVSGFSGISLARDATTTVLDINIAAGAWALLNDGIFYEAGGNPKFVSTTKTGNSTDGAAYYVWLDDSHDGTYTPVWTVNTSATVGPSTAAILIGKFAVSSQVITSGSPVTQPSGLSGMSFGNANVNHEIATGNKPTVVANAGAGTAGSAALDANATDTAGIVTITLGSGSTIAGAQATITYANPFPNGSYVVASFTDSANKADNILTGLYAVGTATTAVLGFSVAGTATHVHAVTYRVVGY